MSRKGFTLAEILITLTVIGVVAALTIPTLLQNTNQAELKTAWKKSYADINQAALQIINDDGGSLVNMFNSNDDIANAFNAKLSTIKTCSSPNSPGNCFHNTAKWESLDGSLLGPWTLAGAILNNGTLVDYRFDSKECVSYCGFIIVDVNGFKEPNVVGKDIFGIFLKDNGTKPHGDVEGQTSACLTGSGSGAGWGCSSRYLYE